jgi:hypothetical protein
MNTYSKSPSEVHEHTFEAINGDTAEINSDKKSIAKPKAHVKKGTAATRLAARKRSAAKKMRTMKHATR